MRSQRRFEQAVLRGMVEREGDRTGAVVTWRYLRIGLVLLALALLIAVGFEAARAGCWQRSLSDYAYTPAGGVFSATLVSIGVALICLRGASDGEDVLLGLAGLCAPFVALVPIDPPDEGCGAVIGGAAERDLALGAGVTALLIALTLGLVAVAVASSTGGRTPSTVARLGFATASGGVLTAWVVFLVGRDLFSAAAHIAAAVLLFVLVFANVVLNAVQRALARQRAGGPAGRLNRYALIAAVMAVDVVVHVVLAMRGWPYAVLSIEATLIVLFAVFWAAQTGERWQDGVTPRPRPRRTPARTG